MKITFAVLNKIIMKRPSCKLWINVLATLSVVAYIYLMCSTVFNEWENMSMGGVQGWNKAAKDNGKEVDVPLGDVYYLTLKPKLKEDLLRFPEIIENLSVNTEMSYRPYKMKIYYPEDISVPKGVKVWNVVAFLFGVVGLVIWFFIPFVFFKLLRTLRSGVFFDCQNVKCFRKIGWASLIAYVSVVCSNYCYDRVGRMLFEFADYDLVHEHTDVMLLLIGLVFLIFAEVLKNGIEIKKEQELTV